MYRVHVLVRAKHIIVQVKCEDSDNAREKTPFYHTYKARRDPSQCDKKKGFSLIFFGEYS